MAQPTTAQPAVAAHHGPSLVRGLSLTDSVMLLAGGIIGSGIFLTAWADCLRCAHAVVLPGSVAGRRIDFPAGVLRLCRDGRNVSRGGRAICLFARGLRRVPRISLWMDDLHRGPERAAIAALAEYFGAVLPFASAHVSVATIFGWTLTRGHTHTRPSNRRLFLSRLLGVISKT